MLRRTIAGIAATLVSCAVFAAEPTLDTTLPDAYIESDGTSYIDTGYTPSTNTSVYCDFEYRDVTAQQFIYESGDSVNATNSNYKTYFRTYISGNGYYAWAMNRQLWQNFGIKAKVGERCQILQDGPAQTVTFTAGSTTKVANPPSWNSRSRQASAYTFKLFSNSWGTGNKAKARIYRFKIYEAGELVRDFTPAQRDGFVGFHDSVTGDFIFNTSGVFSFGGVAELPEIVDPYIESDGTAGINTGVQCQPGLKIEVDYQITKPLGEMVPQWRIVATDADDKNPRVSAYVNGSTNIALTSGNSWASSTSTGIKADTNRYIVVLGDTGNKCYYQQGRKVLATINGNAYTKKSQIQIALLATPKADFGTTFDNKAKAKLYGARFWVNGKLIRDFRPRTVNGVAGLEDVVNGGFYTGAGYTASAGVPEGLTVTPPYIESDGSFFSYVNTYYYVNPKTKVELDYQMVKPAASKILFGSYGASVGTTALMWHDGSGNAYPQAKDGNYSAPTMSPKITVDSGRHTALIDIPAGRLAVMDVNGVVETEGTCSNITKTAAWPSLLFAASKDKYGHAYSGQMATCRIYGARIWEKEGDEYVLVHNFTPVKMTGIPGFKDEVTGKFFSGDKLTTGGNVPTMDDSDPYLDSPDGGRYFDTGYKVTKNTSVWMDFMPLLQQNNQQFPYEAGASNSDGNMYIRTYGNGSAGTGDYSHAFGTDTFKPSYVPYQPNVRVQIFNDTVNMRFKVLRDGVELGGTNYASWATSSVTAQSADSLKIFCDHKMTGSACRGRLYGLKIYESGVLVRDYVPVAQVGKGALFDKVQGKVLKKASNSKEFVVSDDLTANDAWLMADQRTGDAYITSDGSQAIDTGYIPKPNSRFEIDYQFTSFDGQNRIFGETSDKNVGLSAEMYIQGTTSGSGNVAYGVGDEWKGQYTEKGGDKNRNRGFLDVAAHAFGYSGNSFGMKAETTAYTATLNGSYATLIFGRNAYGTMKDFSKMKLYAFRIYESGALVHQYLPYKNGNVVGVYDTVTGAVLTDCREGKAFTYGGEGYGQYRGEPCGLVVKPANASVSMGGTATLTAYAPGAVGYKWTKNGEVIAGATGGSLAVQWTQTQGKEVKDTYAVTPVFSVEGVETEGAAAEAVVTSKLPGLSIFVR